MSTQSNSKSKGIGILSTAIFHIALLLVCYSSGIKKEAPKENESILIDFSQEREELPKPKPIDVLAGIEPRVTNPNPNQDIKLVQKSEAQNIGTKPNIAEEATVGTDGDVEVPEPPRKEINKRALFSSSNNSPKDTLAAQTASKVSDALTAGHPEGNTKVGNTQGAPSAKLAGRTATGALPLPSYNVQKSGKVVVRITVDRNGKVTSAIPGYQGTTVTDKTLWEAAKEAALKATFNISSTAPVSQEGTITYVFTLR